jgi:hypothetical protein
MRRIRAVPVSLFTLAIVFATSSAGRASPVSPYDAHPRGLPYESWAEMTGQYYLGDSSNPLIAGLDGDCGRLSNGVFMLAAPITVDAEFDCDVPTGTWIVLSHAAWFSTAGVDGDTDAELEAAAMAGWNTSIDWLTLDGSSVALSTIDTGAYDVISEPGSFYDTIYQVGTGPIRTVIRGNVVVIHPLAPGDHVIESAVSFVGDGDFSATYTLHVG